VARRAATTVALVGTALLRKGGGSPDLTRRRRAEIQEETKARDATQESFSDRAFTWKAPCMSHEQCNPTDMRGKKGIRVRRLSG
jgi:hypothetical protein